MRFTLTIECDNDAFNDPTGEIAWILGRAAQRVEIGTEDGVLSDTNGNLVGSFRLHRD